MPSRRKRVSRNVLPNVAAIEHLEDRTLLSGNVLVSLGGNGVLTIRGDQSADSIAIQQTSSGVQVSSGDSGATEINGSANPFTASSTVKSIRIQMKAGDNTIQIGDPTGATQLSLTGSLTIRATTGNNTVSLANAQIGKGLSISAGKGDNNIVLGSTTSTSGGNPLTDVNLGAVKVGGNLAVSIGSGSNSVALVNVSVGGKTSLHTGSGGDDLALMTNDGATLSKGLSINAGSGADNVMLNGYTVGGKASINTRTGDDTLGFFATTFERSVSANGGAGSNTYLSNAKNFANTFAGGTAHLRNFQSQPTDVTKNDSAFTDAFSWVSGLLNADGLLNLTPTAVNQSFSTGATTVLSTGNLLTSNTDPNGGTLAVASVDDSSGKSVPLGTATTLPSVRALDRERRRHLHL